MILEGIVTTQSVTGEINIAPMGPHVDADMKRFTLRPFNTSTTYRNLREHGEGVLHVIDDVMLLAQAALSKLDPLPRLVPARSVRGWVLPDACRAFEFRVLSFDDRTERVSIEVEVVDVQTFRDFFGFNRAKHAIVEAAILATRLHLLPRADIEAEFAKLAVIVQKTAGEQERQAFDFLRREIAALPIPTGSGAAPNFLPSPIGRGAGGEGASALHDRSVPSSDPVEEITSEVSRNPPLPTDLLKFARELRTNQTDAEAFVWSLVRDRRIGGFKFRRQHPVDPYSLDFYCLKARLAVELDGGQHNLPAKVASDQRRTDYLCARGIRVLRFWNHEVLSDTDAVLQVIWDALHSTEGSTPSAKRDAPSPPTPLPEGEGRNAGAAVRVRTASRLHFGLLALPNCDDDAPEQRSFGGIGMMIDQPGVEVLVRSASRFTAEGPHATRAAQFAERCSASLGLSQPVHVQVVHAPPDHVGLGTGTQLALAIARGIAALAGQRLDAVALAAHVGRGLRSAIGVHGFQRGGFLVEGGKLDESAISPLIGRWDVPDDWRVVLISPKQLKGTHGPRELVAFADLQRQAKGSQATDAMCRVVLLDIIPALLERNLDAFGAALHEYNRKAGEMFRDVQGGIYADPWIAHAVEAARSLGVRGVGQSSWGPTVFAIANHVHAESIATHLAECLGDCEIVIARGCNGGATTSVE